ncbi:MAG TPA: protein arginine kinase [Clostridiaceae bacterium]|jgi:protein arginine kinase|nr:protein arginine kinase [Clostridiaceae bacterium]HBF77818.1 protein arginine kinase [Clostridiaceae bacterium]HBG38903.1 protein arginine kinase [Clostridiaceae bacterium]
MTNLYSNMNGSDIIITSRIRLARNIKDIPFPHELDENKSNEIIDKVYGTLSGDNLQGIGPFHLVRFNNLSSAERFSMVERHLISKELISNASKSATILNENENVSIMINEEDHIRLQVMMPGFKLKEALNYANELDDIIEGKIDYAFDNKLGYLTSCPTNVGTGLRASVMLHLPALSISKSVGGIRNTLNQVGMTIRGIYGEGSSSECSIYQVSNQVTLGLSEGEIINSLIAVVSKIVDQEKAARQVLNEKQGKELEDDLYRSIGILKYARMLSSHEALNLLSNVRMGIDMGIIKDVKPEVVNELIVKVQPATLQLQSDKELSGAGRDELRAAIVREAL